MENRVFGINYKYSENDFICLREEINKVCRQVRVVAHRINISENSFAYEETNSRSLSFKDLLSTTPETRLICKHKNKCHPASMGKGIRVCILFSLSSRVLRKVQQEMANPTMVAPSVDDFNKTHYCFPKQKT